MAFLAVIKLTEIVRLQMIKVLGVMIRAKTWIHRDAITGEGWRNLQETFGRKMKVASRDTGGKCQPGCVEKFEPHYHSAQDT